MLKLLDLFCCAGGASMGYHLAGFDVTGVDIKTQKNYPFKFVQASAFDVDLSAYDVIHASPPCQFYSNLAPKHLKKDYPDLIAPVRDMLIATGKPYVIENIPAARAHLIEPVMLCGTMFGLNIYRHRYFETNTGIFMTMGHSHNNPAVVLISGVTRRKGFNRRDYSKAEKAAAIGINWMKLSELDEAIPPAYTEWLGKEIAARI